MTDISPGRIGAPSCSSSAGAGKNEESKSIKPCRAKGSGRLRPQPFHGGSTFPIPCSPGRRSCVGVVALRRNISAQATRISRCACSKTFRDLPASTTSGSDRQTPVSHRQYQLGQAERVNGRQPEPAVVRDAELSQPGKQLADARVAIG